MGLSAGWRPHRSVGETREIIRDRMSGPWVFAILERESGQLIGSCGFTGRGRCLVSDTIGYSLRADRWGRGYATEAVRALLGLGFTEVGLQEIWASYYDGNAASRRVLEKAGFTYLYAEPLQDELGPHLVHFCRIDREQWQGESL